jgi:hypothetical protein
VKREEESVPLRYKKEQVPVSPCPFVEGLGSQSKQAKVRNRNLGINKR